MWGIWKSQIHRDKKVHGCWSVKERGLGNWANKLCRWEVSVWHSWVHPVTQTPTLRNGHSAELSPSVLLMFDLVQVLPSVRHGRRILGFFPCPWDLAIISFLASHPCNRLTSWTVRNNVFNWSSAVLVEKHPSLSFEGANGLTYGSLI